MCYDSLIWALIHFFFTFDFHWCDSFWNLTWTDVTIGIIVYNCVQFKTELYVGWPKISVKNKTEKIHDRWPKIKLPIYDFHIFATKFIYSVNFPWFYKVCSGWLFKNRVCFNSLCVGFFLWENVVILSTDNCSCSK